MDKDNAHTVDNKDDILLVAQAAAGCLEQPTTDAATVPAAPEVRESEMKGDAKEKEEPDDDDDDSSSSSSSSSDEDDDEDDLFARPLPPARAAAAVRNRKPLSKEEGDSQAAGTGEEEDDDVDDEGEEDDSDADEGGKKNKTEVTVVKTKNEVARSELPEPEPWPDKIDPSEAVEHVGTLCHCIDDIVTVQALPSPGDRDADSDSRAIDEGSILCFEDRTVLGRVDEVFGQVSQPFYAVRFGKTRRPDMERCKPGTKVFMAVEHTTFVRMDQVMLDRGSDASNIYDEEPAPEELDYSDDEEEARAKSLLKQQFVTPIYFIFVFIRYWTLFNIYIFY